MSKLLSRRILAVAFLGLILSSGCDETIPMVDPPDEEGGGEPPATEQLETEEIEKALGDAQRQPLAMLVQATKPGPAKKTRSLEEARDVIESDPKMEPLREALENGGWSAEQRAQMVYFAGTHLSGAPEDSIRHRQQNIHDELSAEMQRFRTELEAAEERKGVKVDREALREAGVLTTLNTEVIQ